MSAADNSYNMLARPATNMLTTDEESASSPPLFFKFTRKYKCWGTVLILQIVVLLSFQIVFLNFKPGIAAFIGIGTSISIA